jgi:hypothetical protein
MRLAEKGPPLCQAARAQAPGLDGGARPLRPEGATIKAHACACPPSRHGAPRAGAHWCKTLWSRLLRVPRKPLRRTGCHESHRCGVLQAPDALPSGHHGACAARDGRRAANNKRGAQVQGMKPSQCRVRRGHSGAAGVGAHGPALGANAHVRGAGRSTKPPHDGGQLSRRAWRAWPAASSRGRHCFSGPARRASPAPSALPPPAPPRAAAPRRRRP